jgi:thiamine pyrophosphate-dependent acetolactate synthase large subunit-like protein
MYLSPKKRRFVFPIEFGSIGMALATGIGAAVGSPQRDVVVFEGDGGVLMGVQEIETAVRSGVNVTLVVLNDGALGAEYHKLVGKGLSPDDAAYDDVDLAAVSRAMRADAARVTSAADLTAALARHSDSVRVLDVMVSRTVTSRWYRRMYL